RRRKRKWFWDAILVIVAGVLLVPLASAYPAFHRTCLHAQNSADAAAFAGARGLWASIQNSPISEDQIAAAMLDYATINGLEEHDQLNGYYLDAECNRLAPVGSGMPQDARGIEAVVGVRAQIFGVAVWSISRDSRVCYDPAYAPYGGALTMQLVLQDD
ncbi:MAG: hypothetical protein PVH95_12730, partial [Anaerolineae bacterium]